MRKLSEEVTYVTESETHNPLARLTVKRAFDSSGNAHNISISTDEGEWFPVQSRGELIALIFGE